MIRGRALLRAGLALFLGLPPALALALPAAMASEVQRDTLDVQTVLGRQSASLDSLLLPGPAAVDTALALSRARELDAAGLDGLKSLGRFDRPAGLRLSHFPGVHGDYNRVEGYRVGLGGQLSWRRVIRLRPEVHYAMEPHRWGGGARLSLGRPTVGPGAAMEWREGYQAFGSDQPAYGATPMALLAGQDRVDRLRRRELNLQIWPWRTDDSFLWLESFDRQDWSALAGIDAHLFGGGTPIERPNPAVDDVQVRAAVVGASTRWRGDLLAARVEAGVMGGALGGDRDASWQQVSATLRPVFPDGGVLTLRVTGRNTGGGIPLQDAAYLGGDSNLRGYPHRTFSGRRMAAARVEYELGLDLLGRSQIPVIDRLRLQFIPFADLGTTWGTANGIPGARSLDGEVRSSFGLGIRRDIWLPGAASVRFDLIRPTDGPDRDLHFLFRIENF